MGISWDIDGLYETDAKGDYVRLIVNIPIPWWLYKLLHLHKYLKQSKAQ